ncbi:uncharacterized protein BO72DRAFT_246384 [Aspergillus fijiensis CBS 313.89]|uniref:Uncharacterized protein n=1 Tax=Aspergillus fijiensis CBS 313.89 TaxID=1448319 RepID=A0A8G1RGE7_9EURO|nr:uncharacterized protein BO72DRAFT_246384 [Aspergillus fijiensis CBS 313.89]RAK73357.1 hypothetical protein BO72DRAFT_246384 [Aspergillus fijiensis CBS 313.89]
MQMFIMVMTPPVRMSLRSLIPSHEHEDASFGNSVFTQLECFACYSSPMSLFPAAIWKDPPVDSMICLVIRLSSLLFFFLFFGSLANLNGCFSIGLLFCEY